MTTAYNAIGGSLESTIQSYLDSEKMKGVSYEEFFPERVNIKNLQNQIVRLKPKPIQLLHQRRKEEAKAKGKKGRFLLLKYRRGGFTTWEQALSYKAVVTVPNTTCVTLADTKDNTKSIFRMVRLMGKHDKKKPVGYNDTTASIEVRGMNTVFDIGTAGSKAFKRGDNLYRVHGSEVAHWAGDYDTVDNLVIGLTEAAMYGDVIFETTANGAQGWFYEKYKEAMEDSSSQWTPLFYPWFEDGMNQLLTYSPEKKTEFYDTIEDEEQELMERYNLNLNQMLWRRAKINENRRLFPQEYPETWNEAFLVRGHTFFDSLMLTELSKKLKKPLNDRENIVVWVEPVRGRIYCAGADPAQGNPTSDNSVMGIIDKESGEQVAVLRGKWRPEVFARKCIDLCKHYNNAMYACEVNNHGHSVLNTVINTLQYSNLYYYERPINKNKYGDGDTEKVPGFNTNAKTRPILLDELNEALEERFMIVNDPIFIAEGKTFIDTGKRYEADSGEHDDTIIAWGVSWQCRKQQRESYKVL